MVKGGGGGKFQPDLSSAEQGTAQNNDTLIAEPHAGMMSPHAGEIVAENIPENMFYQVVFWEISVKTAAVLVAVTGLGSRSTSWLAVFSKRHRDCEFEVGD